MEHLKSPLGVEQAKRYIVGSMEEDEVPLSDEEITHEATDWLDWAIKLIERKESENRYFHVKGDNLSVYDDAEYWERVIDGETLNSAFEQAAKRYGWVLKIKSPKGRASWSFIPNYTKRIDNVPDILYHVTPKENTENIQKRGLLPKQGREFSGMSGRRNYPERIYVAGSKDAARDIIKIFKRHEKKEYVVFAIDKNKLPKGTKFHLDSEFLDSNEMFWTYTPIPAGAVSVAEDI